MGLHPDEIGRFPYPEFSRYLSYYTDPKAFFEGPMDKQDAMEKLINFNSWQQELIRKAEKRKKEKKFADNEI